MSVVPFSQEQECQGNQPFIPTSNEPSGHRLAPATPVTSFTARFRIFLLALALALALARASPADRKSTRLNSSHWE